MSWVTLSLTALLAGGVVLALVLVALVFLFLRATRGAKGLKARIERLFLLPVRERPLPKSHYFKAYWER